MNATILRTLCLLAPLLIGTSVSDLSAQELANPKAKPNPAAVAREKVLDATPHIQVCFVLDTTGSMSGLIQGAKDKIWSIANELATSKPAPKIEFGLIGYRDRSDTYITKLTDLNEDLDTIHTKLNDFQAGGGGDGPESVNQALHESVTQISWSKDDAVLKIIFLVGDAPPHMDYDEVQYPEICALAMEKDLVINTIQCGSLSTTTPIWRDIASKAEGQFSAILQNGGTVAIATPFDKKITALNIKLNKTVVSYGTAQVHQQAQSKIYGNESSKPESIADRADFYSQSRWSDGMSGGRKGKVIGGKDDLVEQLMNDEIELSAVDGAKLPEELRALPKAEQAKAIEERVANRKKLQTEMDDLVKKRSAFISEEKAKQADKGEADSFDLNVKKMIREQGAAKGIKFSK